MRRVATYLTALTLLAAALPGQSPAINRLLRDLEDSIHAADLVKAADLASTLDEKVQRQFRASLNRDTLQRVTEVLRWLPANTEALFVLQEPIDLKSTDVPETFAGRPAPLYALDRLMALNGGEFYRRLGGHTVGLTVAGIGGIGQRAFGGVPSVMPRSDVMYFYFFTEPLGIGVLGTPEELVASQPLWRGTAKIDAGEPWRPGIHERALREDENWIALVRPDLLVLSSRRQAVINLLGRLGEQNPNSIFRALPEAIPEWEEVDRRTTFWGLRHYSEPGKRGDVSNPRAITPDGPPSDPLAIGVTVDFDTESGALEIHYLSAAQQLPRVFGGVTAQQFEVNTVRGGDWQLKANTHDKGDFPFHVAAELLGFGGYR